MRADVAGTIGATVSTTVSGTVAATVSEGDATAETSDAALSGTASVAGFVAASSSSNTTSSPPSNRLNASTFT